MKKLFFLFAVSFLFFASKTMADPNVGPGCAASDGLGQHICYDCWPCDGGGTGCLGNCASPCGTCYSIVIGAMFDQLSYTDATTGMLVVVNINKGWTVSDITWDGQPAIELDYVICEGC